jgi:HPt (histidine-containing phosphotransfer) domain-containing protein
MKMPQNPTSPLYSTLASDPDLGEIVELFVGEMPNRVGSLRERLGETDWEGLRRVAHQLKGAAGSYGFQPITQMAASVEDSIRQAQPEEEIRRLVDELIAMCSSARAGLPE